MRFCQHFYMNWHIQHIKYLSVLLRICFGQLPDQDSCISGCAWVRLIIVNIFCKLLCYMIHLSFCCCLWWYCNYPGKDAKSEFSWGFIWILILGLAAAGIAGYAVYKYRIRVSLHFYANDSFSLLVSFFFKPQFWTNQVWQLLNASPILK